MISETEMRQLTLTNNIHLHSTYTRFVRLLVAFANGEEVMNFFVVDLKKGRFHSNCSLKKMRQYVENSGYILTPKS